MTDIVRDPYGNPLRRSDEITRLRAENERLRAALQEKVSRALWETTGLSAFIDAALAIVLEEAARVAEAKSDEWTAEWRKGLKCDSHLEGMSDGADEIAAAIRAMIK